MRISNTLDRYLLLPLDLRNVSATFEPNGDLFKVEDLVLVWLKQFVSLVRLQSFSWVGMQHFPDHFRQFFRVPTLKDIQKLPNFDLIELVFIRLSVYFSAISESASLENGQSNAKDLRISILRIIDHRLFLL